LQEYLCYLPSTAPAMNGDGQSQHHALGWCERENQFSKSPRCGSAQRTTAMYLCEIRSTVQRSTTHHLRVKKQRPRCASRLSSANAAGKYSVLRTPHRGQRIEERKTGYSSAEDCAQHRVGDAAEKALANPFEKGHFVVAMQVSSFSGQS
jgi:hypothetical protein